jgi:hypothetical protein
VADTDLPPLAREQKVWAAAAAALFLLAIGFLGFALNARVRVVFAVGWVMLQIFGFVGALKMAKGDFAHPLFKSQVILHESMRLRVVERCCIWLEHGPPGAVSTFNARQFGVVSSTPRRLDHDPAGAHQLDHVPKK